MSKIPRPQIFTPKYCISESWHPNFEPHSELLKPKATGVHLVGHKQASIADILWGSVASRKVEDSEAASPNFPSHRLYFHHYWLQGPTSSPIHPRYILKGRRFRGLIPKLSHLNTASLTLGTPTSSPILSP